MAPGGCGGQCIDNNWKMPKMMKKKCCYHVCEKCFAILIRQGGGGRQGAQGNQKERGDAEGKSSRWEF